MNYVNWALASISMIGFMVGSSYYFSGPVVLIAISAALAVYYILIAVLDYLEAKTKYYKSIT